MPSSQPPLADHDVVGVDVHFGQDKLDPGPCILGGPHRATPIGTTDAVVVGPVQ